MALILNGTTVDKIKFNGTDVTKVIYNGTTIWEDWILHTGNLYVMTSNSLPSPYVISKENSYGTYTQSTSNYYYAFNNDSGNNVTITASGNQGYIGIQIVFNKTIRVKKVLFDGSNSGNADRQIYLYGDGTSKLVSNAPVSQTYNITDGDNDYFEATSMKYLVRTNFTGATANLTVKKCQVTEWYEK